jgi:hypothetical protein
VDVSQICGIAVSASLARVVKKESYLMPLCIVLCLRDLPKEWDDVNRGRNGSGGSTRDG